MSPFESVLSLPFQGRGDRILKIAYYLENYTGKDDWQYRYTRGRCWDCGGTVVKLLCYKSEGRWFDPGWCH